MEKSPELSKTRSFHNLTSKNSSSFKYNRTFKIADDVIFFVNPKSGEQHGRFILNYGIKSQISKQGRLYKLHFFDLTREFAKGAKLLHEIQTEDSSLLIKVVIGGGDGTVLRLVESLMEEGIDVMKILIGLIPLGTGNDLHNSLGWGCS